MFGWNGISDHSTWNEVFYYRDTKLSCVLNLAQSVICKYLERIKDQKNSLLLGKNTIVIGENSNLCPPCLD